MTPAISPYFNTLLRYSFVVLFTVFSFATLLSQDRCGTVEYNKMISGTTAPQDRKDQFENWLSKKIQQQKTQPKQSKEVENSKESATIVEIPVVIHIVHNGEPLGTGLNIPDAQIQSQIEVLNEDFRRMNADKVNTPANFVGVAADAEIEFVMAKRDPEGLATSAIVRVVGSQSSWSMGDNTVLKSLSYWPAEDYLNIWVTNISGTLLGYAQFPVSSGLGGLDEASANALTDGIVVDYEVFGSIDKYPAANLKNNFDKGRTATHEVGHFLGLRHIWGDASCGTDYCDDTPTQKSSTSGCPSHPRSNTCGSSDEMFDNYMDYTSDQCMNLFTLDQNDRMRTVINNSPRRASLTTSLGLLNPVVYDHDLGIFAITSPETTTCDQLVTPTLIVKNYGNNDLNSVQIKLSNNGNLIETLTVNLGGLSQLISTTVMFSEVSLSEGDNNLVFEIINVNGIGDENAINNIIDYIVNIPAVILADITEDFQSGIESMTINNIDGTTTWEIVDAPDGTSGNKALYINYYNYENEGTEDWLLSPVMDFSSLPVARLVFDYAHAQYPGRNDQLKVLISSNCGQSYQVLFDKSGSELMTTSSASTGNFVPSSSDDWASTSVDLSAYVGNPAVQIAFVGKNAFGNNIYLDNITLITSDETSVKLRQIDTPAIVTGSTTQPLIITVKNIGSFTINELEISYVIDDESAKQLSVTDLDLGSGFSAQLEIGEITATEGTHQASVTISKPNGLNDVDVSDNSLELDFIIDLSTDVIPLRERFENENHWVSATRSEVSWEPIDLQENGSMYVHSAQNSNISGEAWLVSPILDFSSDTEASLFFDLSYALSSNGNHESLRILLSEDGGLDGYPIELYSKSGGSLATSELIKNDWIPKSDSADHWRRDSIVLSQYAGADDLRLAFVLTNGNGNNIYLDNIEFFTSDSQSPFDIGTKEVSHFPNPIFSTTDATLNLVFNLPDRQRADIRIFDLAGNLVFSQSEPYALNQTYTYDASGLPSGMLILSIIGESFKYNSRLVVMR